MLHRALLFTAVAIAGLTSATTTSPPTCDAACKTDALGFLLGRCRSKRLAPACVDDIAADASAFCSGFLAPVTVSQTSLLTATQVQSVTATDMATTTATDTTSSTSTTTITFHEEVTETSTTVTSTSTSTTTVVSLPSITIIQSAVVPRGVRPTACPKLSTARLQRLAPAKVSSVCSVLGVTPSATTVTGTDTVTATSTTTASTETTTSATTTTTLINVTEPTSSTQTITTTTTTSIVAAATATQVIDACHESQIFRGTTTLPQGHHFLTIYLPLGSSATDCCRLCWTQTNCVVSLFIPTAGAPACQYVIKDASGGPTSPQCPSGRLPWLRSDSGPSGFLNGPCGIL